MPPVHLRAAFYSLPLFVHWLIGIVWETDDRVLQSARRALALFLLGLVWLLVLTAIRLLLPALDEQSSYAIQYTFFVLHSLGSAVYVIASVFFAYQEFRQVQPRSGWLHRLTDGFERLVSR